MMRLDLQFFGGRGSAGGNAKAAAEKSVAAAANTSATLTKKSEASEKKSSESSSTPSAETLNRQPMGAAYMSPSGIIYVKQNNANNADWTDFQATGGSGYGITSSELAERMKKGGFTELSQTSTYKAAGSYHPTPDTLSRASAQRKATAPERQIKAIDRKLSNGSSMTKMGSGNAGQYVVELGKKDASSRRLANELRKAGFRQVGNNRWVKNGV